MIASVWADVSHNAIYIPKLCSVVVNGNVRANLNFLKIEYGRVGCSILRRILKSVVPAVPLLLLCVAILLKRIGGELV